MKQLKTCVLMAVALTSVSSFAGGYESKLVNKDREAAVQELNNVIRSSGGISRLIRDAELGNANAKYEVAQMYFHGLHRYPKDYEKGLEVLRESVDLGSAGGSLMLGKVLTGIYSDTIDYRSVDLEPVRGMEMIRTAAVKGNLEAMHILGTNYINAHIVPGDYDLGMFWLSRAADKGYTKAAVDRSKYISEFFPREKFLNASNRVSGGNAYFLDDLAEAYESKTSTATYNPEKAERLRDLSKDLIEEISGVHSPKSPLK